MSPLTTVSDIEKIVSDYLRTHADITAIGARVVGKPPSNTATPWVRVTELDSPQVNQPDHLVESMIQFDCYAGEPGTTYGGQPGANLLARTVRAVLGTLTGSYSGGVVTGVRILGGPRSLDTEFEPARDVKHLTVLIWHHA